MTRLGPAFKFDGGRSRRWSAPPQAYIMAAFALAAAAVVVLAVTAAVALSGDVQTVRHAAGVAGQRLSAGAAAVKEAGAWR